MCGWRDGEGRLRAAFALRCAVLCVCGGGASQGRDVAAARPERGEGERRSAGAAPAHLLPPLPPTPRHQNQNSKPQQRVALVLCLGQPADIYLIDEPSAYLDSEQRIVSAKVIKRFIMHAKKTAFIVEHDFIMARPVALAPALLRLAQGWEGGLEGPRRHHRALLRFPEACLTLSPPYAALHTTPIHAPIQQATYLADRVIVYDGQPSISARAMSPQSLQTGMNTFLAALEARCALALAARSFFFFGGGGEGFGRCARRLRRTLPLASPLARRSAACSLRPSRPLLTLLSPPSLSFSPPRARQHRAQITFRRDPSNYRPRINKVHSVKDREQKEAGTYYYMDE